MITLLHWWSEFEGRLLNTCVEKAEGVGGWIWLKFLSVYGTGGLKVQLQHSLHDRRQKIWNLFLKIKLSIHNKQYKFTFFGLTYYLLLESNLSFRNSYGSVWQISCQFVYFFARGHSVMFFWGTRWHLRVSDTAFNF